jgi:hypothetical protein
VHLLVYFKLNEISNCQNDWLFLRKKVEMKCAQLFPFTMIHRYFYFLHVGQPMLLFLRLINFPYYFYTIENRFQIVFYKKIFVFTKKVVTVIVSMFRFSYNQWTSGPSFVQISMHNTGGTNGHRSSLWVTLPTPLKTKFVFLFMCWNDCHLQSYFVPFI